MSLGKSILGLQKVLAGDRTKEARRLGENTEGDLRKYRGARVKPKGGAMTNAAIPDGCASTFLINDVVSRCNADMSP